ncbi:MAG: ABC transporter permease, partial [bacterium]|nr:ABC transporter permease [bacterium]
MYRNYLKIAFRNIKNHKSYSFINIAGLAIGLACCMLILLVVQDELSYGKGHDNADNIYRIAVDTNINGV